MAAVTIDWTTVVVLIAVNGLIDCGAVAYLAGRQSKKKLVNYLESEESAPLIDKITAAVAAKVVIPKVPSIQEIAGEVRSRMPEVPTVPEIIEALPPYPDVSDKLALLEERVGARVTSAMEAKWSSLQDQLSQRVGQVVQANIASAKAAFSQGMKGVEDAMMDGEGSMLVEAAGMFFDEDSVKKLAKARALFRRMQGAGGLRGLAGGGNGGAAQAAQQPGTYQLGQLVRNERGLWTLTQQGWKLLEPAVSPAALPAPAASVAAPAAADLPPELPAEPKAKA